MKGRKRVVSLLSALVIGMTTVIAPATSSMIGLAKVTYEKNKMYDATEQYLNVQPETYSYNGYKVEPLMRSDDYLSSNGLGEGMAMSTAGPLEKGDKLVIEFQTPIDSKKFETITVHMKQVPGNRYEAYNVNDDILSTVRKTISFGSYDVEKFTFTASQFADSKGMVKAIMLKNIKADEQGQFFVDGFSLSGTPYQLGKSYDANETYLKKQSATSYDGLTVVPFGEVSTFWSVDAKLEGESGSALIASKPEGKALVKGDVLILEFVHEIHAKSFPYLNLNLTTGTGGGASFEFYNVNEIKNGKLAKAKTSGIAGFWGFTTVTLPTTQFADDNGYVQAIAMKLTSKEAATFSVGSFGLTKKKAELSQPTHPIVIPDDEDPVDSKNQYDGNEKNIVVQTQDTYKGIKIVPLAGCGTELAGWGLGEGKAVYTMQAVKKGDVIAIQFVNPIDSKKYETLTLQMKQVPGNRYEAYNGNDTKLSKVCKTISFGSYDIEKFTFTTSQFADSKGMVHAILLRNIKADEEGQFFVDGYSLGNSPYKLGRSYDANETYLKKQSATVYEGLEVVPFGEVSTFWSKEAKVEGESGSALIASKPEGAALVKGDVLILEFVYEINAKKFPYLNLSLATGTGSGATLDFFNVNEIKNGKLGKSKASGNAGFWGFATVSLPTAQFADASGNVQAIVIKLTSEEASTFSVGSFSLTSKKQTISQPGTTTGNDTTKDTRNQYDGNEKNIVVQTKDTYKGIKILPLSGCGSELAGWGIGEGKSVYTNENVKKGDVIAIQFVRPIDSKKADLLTLALKQIPGYSYSLYKGTDTKFEKAIKTLSFGSYDIEMTALRTALFAEKDGKVRTILLKCESVGDAGQFFLDGYSLSKDTYQKGVTYDADEDHVKLQGSGTYGNLNIAPFNERTDFWEKEAKVDTDKGYAVLAHRTDSTSPKKGDLMVLEFVTDIDTSKFEVLNLTMATSSQKGATFEVFNVYTAKDGKNIQSVQRISADFWSFKTNNISLAALADENGYVGAIGLRLVSDEAETFSVGGYSLGSLSDLVEKDKPQILDNKISVFETDDAYEFVVEFNSTGSQTGKDNEDTLAEIVSFNGHTLKEINKEKKNVTLSVDLMGRYCMTLRVRKDYTGVGAVKNADRHFVGNCVEILKGYTLPNGEALKETYALHVYLTDSITNVVSDEHLQSVGVNQVVSGIDANGNLTINVYFTNQITGNPIYFLCNPDSFNKKNVESLNAETILYDATVAEAFIYGGYKASLMDNIIINGNTVAEWMAVDELKGSAGYNTAVMVHYGQASDKAASIIFSGNTEVGKLINKAYESGTLDLRLGAGLKFSTGRELKKTVAYQYANGVWKQAAVDDFAVYYDGQKVVNGQTIQVANEPSIYNVTVLGEGNYQIEEEKDGATSTYTITEDGKERMTFKVEGKKVTMPAVEETSTLPYVVAGVAGILLLAAIAVAIIIITKRRKRQHA